MFLILLTAGSLKGVLQEMRHGTIGAFRILVVTLAPFFISTTCLMFRLGDVVLWATGHTHVCSPSKEGKNLYNFNWLRQPRSFRDMQKLLSSWESFLHLCYFSLQEIAVWKGPATVLIDVLVFCRISPGKIHCGIKLVNYTRETC